MNHVLIVTGGDINIDFIREYIKTLSYDKVFAVDKGLEAVYALGITPDVMIGDFDSVDGAVLKYYDDKITSDMSNTIKIEHPVMKDDTDTALAVRYAMDNEADRITILGFNGSRMDHVLANIGLLTQTVKNGCYCEMVDETNRIRIIDPQYNCKEVIINKDEQFGEYISLIPLKDKVNGITMEGVLYPLNSSVVTKGSTLTISNQITEKTARILIEDGAALLIESRDSWR